MEIETSVLASFKQGNTMISLRVLIALSRCIQNKHVTLSSVSLGVSQLFTFFFFFFFFSTY